jgi:peptide/nickel transport system substrate-binding protein
VYPGRFLIVLAVVAATLVACVGTPPATTTQTSAGGTFTYGVSGDAAVLDPWNVTDDNSLEVTQQIFEPLLTYDPSTFDVKPNLAVSWQASNDRRQWTLKLRDGVTFHDGTPFDSDAVVFNFERARFTTFQYRNKRPAGDDYAYYQSMWGGFDGASLITKVEAFDRLTVRFTTREPFGPFITTLAMATFSIVSPASIKADPEGWMYPTSQAAAGTGPFMFTPGSWRQGEEINLVRNPTYWRTDDAGHRLPYLDRVRLRSLVHDPVRTAELRAGQLDAIRDFEAASAAAFKDDPKILLMQRRPNNVGYLRFNTGIPPFDRPDVRRALSMAIDRDALIDQVFAGYAYPASQFLPPGTLGYDDSVRTFQSYDVTSAKQLLAENGAAGLRFDLWYMDTPRPYLTDPARAARLVADQLSVIGVTATPRSMPFALYRDQLRRNELPVWFYGWTGDNGDPDNFMCVLFCDGNHNGAWDDETAREAQGYLRQAQRETDPARRADLYRQASRVIRRGVPAVPLVHADVPVAVARYVSGYVPHPKGSEPFTFVQVWR